MTYSLRTQATVAGARGSLSPGIYSLETEGDAAVTQAKEWGHPHLRCIVPTSPTCPETSFYGDEPSHGLTDGANAPKLGSSI